MLQINISRKQAYRTKDKSVVLIIGSVMDQYERLWDYAEDHRNRNLGSSVYMKIQEGSIERGKPIFERFYVCLAGIKEAVK